MTTITSASILASIAQAMRDMPPPPLYDRVRFGSTKFWPDTIKRAQAPKETPFGWVSPVPHLSFGGIPVVIDPNMPPYLGYMQGPKNLAVIDLRRRARTNDMAQMLDDLRRFGGVPKP